ncbi:hypothetical protein U91I_00511 [alpha proteobacterium U9-1i]|nr:hypothetical protein U91I_00511 [alpha proteobacterium U9-1i]
MKVKLGARCNVAGPGSDFRVLVFDRNQYAFSNRRHADAGEMC